MEERPLIAFTLLAQGAVGTGLVLSIITSWEAAQGNLATAQALGGMGWPMIAVMVSLGLLVSCAHLGVLANAWRAATNWRTSWLSREIIATGAFAGLSIAAAILFRIDACPHTLALTIQRSALGAGLIAIYCMAMAYRLPAVPAWDSVLTPLSFFLTAFLLGGIACGTLLIFGEWAAAARIQMIWHGLVTSTLVLLTTSLILTGLWVMRLPNELMTMILTGHPALLVGRLGSALLGIGAAVCMIARSWPPTTLLVLHVTVVGTVMVSEILGRALFYHGHAPHDVYLHRG